MAGKYNNNKKTEYSDYLMENGQVIPTYKT